MSTSRADAEAVVAELGEVVEVRIRAMMGGWLVYAQEVLVGQVDDGELFLKATAFASAFAPDLERRPPYPGARPALVVPAALRDDREWLHDLVTGTVDELQARTRPAH